MTLSLGKNVLTIKGEKKQETEDKNNGYYRLERSYGAFQRAIALPEDVDTARVDATFKKGVLTVTVPKLPDYQAGGKKIATKGEQVAK